MYSSRKVICSSKISLDMAITPVLNPIANIPYSLNSETKDYYEEEHSSLVSLMLLLVEGHSQDPVNKLTERPWRPTALISFIVPITFNSYPNLQLAQLVNSTPTQF